MVGVAAASTVLARASGGRRGGVPGMRSGLIATLRCRIPSKHELNPESNERNRIMRITNWRKYRGKARAQGENRNFCLNALYSGADVLTISYMGFESRIFPNYRTLGLVLN
jgi:hypothetical protein